MHKVQMDARVSNVRVDEIKIKVSGELVYLNRHHVK